MDFLQQIRWHPAIGDASLMGWVTVAAYALAAFTAWFAAHRASHAAAPVAGYRGMWILVALLMGFLCINKQLDLQSLVTDIGRVIAHKQGWYDDRRDFQKWLVICILAKSFLTTTIVAFKFRESWRNHFLLGAGLVFLLTFIAIRAISYHSVEALLDSTVMNMKMNWLLELAGISLIWFAAIRDLQNFRRSAIPR